MSEGVTSSAGQIAAQFDPIASLHKTAMDEELWTHTTFFTFTNYVLDGKLDLLKDASVLELGCGEGSFCRWAATQGAINIVGVDISQQQINIAREIERCNPRAKNTSCTIEYIVQDVMNIDGAEIGQFDVILAPHILCYSRNREELQRMLKAMSSCLKRNGRLIGLRECLDSATRGKASMKVKGELVGGPMYSYELVPSADSDKDLHPQDFCQCKFAFRNSDGTPWAFTTFAVRELTMIEMFIEAGFKVNSIGPRLSCSPEGHRLFPPDFIKKHLDDLGKFYNYFDVTKL